MLVLPKSSRQTLLLMLLRHAATLHLFTNDFDLADASLSDLRELTGHGYQPKDLFSNSWKLKSGETVAEHPKVKWVFEGGTLTQIYGYYVVWKSSGDLAWAEKFPDGPYKVRYRGDQLTIQPKLSCS